MVKPWPLISSRSIQDLGLFRITKDRAVSPRTDAEREFLVVHMPDWLQMVALTVDNQIVMVEQYRHGARRIGLEVPGGLMDVEGEEPIQGALRELAEETGFTGGRIVPLGDLWPQPALLANRARFYAAVGVAETGPLRPDEGEDIRVVLVDVDSIDRLIREGRIHNAMTVTALALAGRAGIL